MTFGEYLKAVEDEKIWNATGIHLDQATFIKYLNHVKDVRNGVMHFNSGSSSNLEAQDEEAIVLTALRILRATPLNQATT